MKKNLIPILVLLLLLSCKTSSNISSLKSIRSTYKFNSQIEKFITDSITERYDYQDSAADYSKKGDYQNAIIQWDSAFKAKTNTFSKREIDSIINNHRIVDAKSYIINQSKDNSIIFINESHHNASHRVFTESLLLALYKNGYKQLCLEALGVGKHEDTLLNKRNYPILSPGGYYTDSPEFGNLIRTALKIGFTLHPYETKGNVGGAIREKDQAETLSKLIKSMPNEKFLIHCGSGHAFEGEVHSYFGGIALAGRIHKLTGVNPLTIDQTHYSEKSSIKNNNPILNAIEIKSPSVLISQNNIPISYIHKKGWIDIAIFHPITEYIENRPNWFIQNKSLVPVKLKKIGFSFPVMAFAFKANEDINNAIPVDILELKSNKTVSCLALQKGNYNILVFNEKGENRIYSQNVN